ncbi:hypothetical protein AB0J83_28160 [Actinoplanes sp. NPDC049596]|uniref:hypothetical protein n=1 Tax=unclassified Actinoplanes TaxID=2626549 RepID=UPI003426E406
MAVREIAVDAETERLAGLEPAHYREGFVFDTAQRRDAEAWARLILEGASRPERIKMLTAWRLLAVDLAPRRSPDQVLGWRIAHRAPDMVVLGVHAATGLTARLVLRTTPTGVVHAMLVRYDRPLGRCLWTRFAPSHRRFYTKLLDRSRRTAELAP